MHTSAATVQVSDEGAVSLANLVGFDIDPRVQDVDSEVRSRFVGGHMVPSPSLWVSRVPNAILATPRAVVFTSEGSWLLDSVRNRGKLDRWLDIDSDGRMRPPRPEDRVNQEAVLLVAGASSNYWHWLLESITRIGTARLAGLSPARMKFVVPTHPTPMHRETLAMAGVREDQLISWSGRPCSWKSLVVPSRGLLSTNQLATPAIDYLRSLAEPLRAASPGDGPTRLFVSRSLATHRRAVNEDELLNIAERYGFEGVLPEHLSVVEQVRLFGSAEAIIAPHGAGLTNCVFAPSGAAVLELFAERTRVRIYRHLTAVRGQRYAFCVGPAVESPSDRDERWNDYVVAPERFERVLNDLMAGEVGSP